MTFVIAEAGILLADLNTIAPLITMAFLVTYGLLNLATFYEAITKNPSYRPQFRFCHWSTSLAGAVGCGIVMVLIDWRWAVVALGMVASLHWYLSRVDVTANWGNLQSGLLFERTRRNLLKLEDELYHPKNWRPFVLALSGQGFSRPHLVVFGSWLTADTGVLTLGQVIPGELDDRHQRRISQEKILHAMIGERKLSAFPAVVVAADYITGVEALVQCQGLGRLRPNTILLGCPLTIERMRVFCGLLRNLEALGRSVVVLRRTDEPEDDWDAPKGTIDVWWRGRANGELMVLLAHLILGPSSLAGSAAAVAASRRKQCGNRGGSSLTWIDCFARPASRESPRSLYRPIPRSAIQTTSRDAAFVFLGMQTARTGHEDDFFHRTESLVGSRCRGSHWCKAPAASVWSREGGLMPNQTRIVSPGPSDRVVRSEDGNDLVVPVDWELLPPGDPGWTRRVKAAGPSWTVKEKKGRRTFSRGVWAPKERIERIRIELEAERSTEAYAKKRQRAASRRAETQAEYVEDFRGAVLAFLGFTSEHAAFAERLADAVTTHATPVGSGTVAQRHGSRSSAAPSRP